MTPTDWELHIDVGPLAELAVGARGLLRFRLENYSTTTVARAELRCRLAEVELAAATDGELTGAQAFVLTMLFVPRVAGYAELAGRLSIMDEAGVLHELDLEPLQLLVRSGAAPVYQFVHVDQRSARVVDNSHGQFGGSGGVGTRLLGERSEGMWRRVELLARPTSRAIDNSVTEAPFAAFRVETGGASYSMRSVLARGDLATVFAGEENGAGRQIVAKIADDPADSDLLEVEARVLSRLRAAPSKQAKHLPMLLDRFRTADGRFGTIFERLDGLDLVTLRERLGGAVPGRHLLWILRRALSVLGWAHHAGVVHGNVEPAHLVVRPRDHNVWLVDWCWSVVEPARTGEGFRCANEVYGPPEAREGGPPLPASDLYALGKTLVYAAGGDPVNKTVSDEVDPRIGRFLRFLCQESQAGRPQDAWELYRQVDHLRREVFGPHTFVELEVPAVGEGPASR
ncbi:MAG: hypothetical protein U0271_09850 [Polyangiaceae bacterium]